MKTVFLALLTAVALVLAPAVANAGGGSKGTGTITVQNNSGDTVVAIAARTNNPLTNLTNLLNSPGTVTQAQVQAAAAADGARAIVISDGNPGTIAGLQAGAYTITVADITAGNVGGSFVNTSNAINVGRGQRVRVTIGSGGAI